MSGKPKIDLDSKQGEAMALLVTAKRFCSQLSMDFVPIERAMKSGDYNNLLAVFDKNFGEYVELIRSSEESLDDNS